MPTIIYWAAIISAFISYVVQIIAVVIIIVSLFTRNHDIWCEGIKDLFDSGVQIRNVSYFFMFFLFMISTHQFQIRGVDSLESIANICKMYGVASILTLLLCIFSMILRTIKKVNSPHVVGLIHRCRKSVIFSIATGLFVYYLLIPSYWR